MNKEILNIGESSWISAHAGTGKTKVIIDRILALLLQGIAPQKILAVTFTNAAAAEMKERVAAELIKLYHFNDDELSEFLNGFFGASVTTQTLENSRGYLSELYETHHELRIQTIHSFCQNILQSFPIEAGLKPGFEIVDDNYAKELLEEAKEQVFSNEAIEPVITHIIENFHYEIITEILDEVVSKRVKIEFVLAKYESFNDYLTELYQFLDITKNEQYKIEITSDFRKGVSVEFLQELKTSIDQFGGKTDLKKQGSLAALIANKEFGFNDFQKVFCSQKQDLLKRAVTAAVSKEIENYETKIHELQSLYQEKFELYKKHELAEITENLLLVAQVFLASYRNIKEQKSLIDYEDIILSTLNLLKNSEQRDNILYKYDLSLEHILLDEAQDTSPWQWEIIKLLLEDFFAGASGDSEVKKSFFIVGDEKQSIYSFQGADHKLFSAVKLEFKQRLENIGRTLHELQLDTSYRSQEPILTLVDKFFNKAEIREKLAENVAQIEHKVSRKTDNADLTIWPKLESEAKRNNLPFWEYPKEYVKKTLPKAEAAQKLAGFIQSKLAKADKIATSGAGLRAKDIMILTRKRDQNYKAIISALEEASIPVQSDQRFKLLDHVLIMDLVGFLKFVYFPKDDLNLASILKSPLFNKSEEEIFDICYNRAESTIYEVISSDELICEKLQNLQEMSAILDLKGFYLYLLESVGLKRQYLKIYGRKADRLCELFLNVVENFTKQSDNKRKFLEFIHSYEINAGAEIISDLDAVTVMTMHKSKGLQAPVVIVALDNQQKTSMKRNYLEVDFANNLVLACNVRKVADLESYQEAFSLQRRNEELRLLYVALTRARDELHIVPFNKEGAEDEIYDGLLEAVGEEFSVDFAPVIKSAGSDEVMQKCNDDSNVEIFTSAKVKKDPEIEIASQQVLHNKKQAQIGSIYHDLFNYLTRGGKVVNLLRFTEISYAKVVLSERKEIVANMNEIYQDKELQYLFKAKGHTELALSLRGEHRMLTGRIDRIILNGEEARIIDYKFESGPEIKPEYKSQLDFYEKLVRANFSEVTKVSKQLFFIPSRKLVTV